MANKFFKVNTLQGLLIMSLLGITACVDDAYDL